MYRREVHCGRLQIVRFRNFLQPETKVVARRLNGILQNKRESLIASLFKALRPHQFTAGREMLLQSIRKDLQSVSLVRSFQSLNNEAITSRHAIRSALDRELIKLFCFN